MNFDIKKMVAAFVVASQGCDKESVITALSGLVCNTYQKIYPDREDEQIMAINNFSTYRRNITA